MYRLLSTLIVAVLGLVVVSELFAEEAVYRWEDSSGRLHFSNGVGGVPSGTAAAELAPLNMFREVPGPKRLMPPRQAQRKAPERPAPCDWPDTNGLVAAVKGQLAETGDLGKLALFVGAVPVAHSTNAIVRTYRPEKYSEVWAEVDQAASISYPGSGVCPSRPPLRRRPVTSRQPDRPGELCNDFRRAFAEVGVAVNRNGEVARPFREIAESFVKVAAEHYEARGSRGAVALNVTTGSEPMFQAVAQPIPPGRGVRLSPWLVEAHIAQLNELARETEEFVDELTIALEEIDRAARARGCW